MPKQKKIKRIAAKRHYNYTKGDAFYREENNDQKAMEYFLKAAKMGYPAAYLRLSRLYKGDLNIPANQNLSQLYAQKTSENFQWFKTQVEKKSVTADAQFNLAECYAYGFGVPKNINEAINYYALAANQGHELAAETLGFFYEKGVGVPENWDQALYWYQQAANNGNCWAQNYLGDYYLTQPDAELFAISYYFDASKKKYRPAQYNLGRCYEYGRGIDYDFKTAFLFYELSSNQEYAPAQYRRGLFYELGRVVEQDFKIAYKWYKKAALQEYPPAQYAVGRLYEYGIPPTPPNFKKAYKWYQKASLGGDEDARLALDTLLKAHPELVSKNNNDQQAIDIGTGTIAEIDNSITQTYPSVFSPAQDNSDIFAMEDLENLNNVTIETVLGFM